MIWHVVNRSPNPDTDREVLGIRHDGKLTITCYQAAKGWWRYNEYITQWCDIELPNDIMDSETVLKAVFPRIKI